MVYHVFSTTFSLTCSSGVMSKTPKIRLVVNMDPFVHNSTRSTAFGSVTVKSNSSLNVAECFSLFAEVCFSYPAHDNFTNVVCDDFMCTFRTAT